MYSCNWTEMDLKMKKLLLLAMQMEDANKMMLKITPKKIVDIQLFSNVSFDYEFKFQYPNNIKKN